MRARRRGICESKEKTRSVYKLTLNIFKWNWYPNYIYKDHTVNTAPTRTKMILFLRVETLKNQSLLDGVCLSTVFDKNVKKMHVVWIILEYFPLQPGSLKILPPPPPKKNNVEVWPTHFCSRLNNIDQGGGGEGSPWCQIRRVGVLWASRESAKFLTLFVQDCSSYMGILPPGSEVISIHAFVLTMKHFYRDHVCFTSTNGFSSFPPRLQKEPLW